MFIEKAKEVHSNKYDYSLVDYVDYCTKVTIVCEKHGSFEQTPKSHLRGSGCPKCAREKIGYGKRSNNFIEKAISIHGDTYDYSNTLYTTALTKVSIKCKIHGEFQQLPNNHLHGRGCRKCGNAVLTNILKKDVTTFVKEASLLHANIYSYENVVYINNYTKVSIICPIHGEFFQEPHDHLKGRGCPRCVRSGFNPEKPAILYFLSVNEGQAYKIGITNRTVEKRYNSSDLSKIVILHTIEYENGLEALLKEQQILKEYAAYKYTGEPLLFSGNSELLTIDLSSVLK